MQINTVAELENGYLVNDEFTVPLDPANIDYQAVQDWVDEPNAPTPHVAPLPPPMLTNTQKLEASNGLTLAEIKLVLGI